MSSSSTSLLRDKRNNAILGWIIVGLLTLVVGESLLDGDLLWAAFAASLAVITLFPPLSYRSPVAMPPWEILLLAVLPAIGRRFATVPATGNLARYLSVAAIALIIAVEIQLFTPVRMTPRFAVTFVGVATLATAGFWAVVRWISDQLLGTTLLLDPALTEHAIEEALMWEFVASTIAGIGAGLVFAVYIRQQIGTDRTEVHA
jgi:hypothetical protein